jgi:Arm DNA-binding domain
LFPSCGAIAQLGERLVRNEEVSGSIPLSSTNPTSREFQQRPYYHRKPLFSRLFESRKVCGAPSGATGLWLKPAAPIQLPELPQKNAAYRHQNSQCQAKRPSSKPVRLFDERGLYLEVSPAGGKWWRLKYRFAAKEKRLSLGVYPDVTLKDARDRRDAALAASDWELSRPNSECYL